MTSVAGAGPWRRRGRYGSGAGSGVVARGHRRVDGAVRVARRVVGHARPVRRLRQPERVSVSAGRRRRSRDLLGDDVGGRNADGDGRDGVGERVRRRRRIRSDLPTGRIYVVDGHLLSGE